MQYQPACQHKNNPISCFSPCYDLLFSPILVTELQKIHINYPFCMPNRLILYCQTTFVCGWRETHLHTKGKKAVWLRETTNRPVENVCIYILQKRAKPIPYKALEFLYTLTYLLMVDCHNMHSMQFSKCIVKIDPHSMC